MDALCKIKSPRLRFWPSVPLQICRANVLDESPLWSRGEDRYRLPLTEENLAAERWESQKEKSNEMAERKTITPAETHIELKRQS